MAAPRLQAPPFVAPRTDAAAIPWSSTSPPITARHGEATPVVAAGGSPTGAADMVSRKISAAAMQAGDALRQFFVPRHLDTSDHMHRHDDHSSRLSAGAIAGIVVGVVVAVILVLFCAYPFVIRRLKRRRNAHLQQPDTETGMATTEPGSGVGGEQRVSSNDSLKEAGQSARGDVDLSQTRDMGWAATDRSYPGPDQPWISPVADPNSPTANQFVTSRSSTFRTLGGDQSAPFPAYDGQFEEFFQPPPESGEPGVLQGTSADYYSPSIPSEAFGMFQDEEEATPRPDRSSSHHSSLKHTVRHMLRRKSGREGTLSSHASDSPTSFLPRLDGAIAMQQMITDQEATHSPTELSPPALKPLPGDRSAAGEAKSTPPGDSIKTPPRSPPLDQDVQMPASPPARPAPGTVNPMEVMPASTESERWYHTEHQLNVSTQGPSPSPELAVVEPSNIEYASVITSPSPEPELLERPTEVLHPTLTTDNWHPSEIGPSKDEDIVMNDMPSHNYLCPLPLDSDRRPSDTSEGSGSNVGHGSSVPSSQNTPATQLDYPSPESLGSSDFRNSASPRMPVSVPSPRNGMYHCTEPGCPQVFDQPHKLKYVHAQAIVLLPLTLTKIQTPSTISQ